MLTDWDETFGAGNATLLLNLWTGQFLDAFQASLQPKWSHRVFLKKFLREIQPFDWVSIAGWQPDENRLSDVIAALFDTRWGHSFGTGILLRVINTLASRNPNLVSIYQDLQWTIGEELPRINVRRERRGSSSRADIDVHTRGVRAIFVRIEHKLRGGVETYVRGKKQTDRLWTDAVERAHQLNIKSENVVGIFLVRVANHQRVATSAHSLLENFLTDLRQCVEPNY